MQWISAAMLSRPAGGVLALLIGVFLFGGTRALGDAESQLQPSLKPDNADPATKTSAVDDSAVETDKVLDLLLAAARDTRAGMRSASGKAKFDRWMRQPGEEGLRQMTSGILRMYYDEGKYHLSFTHEKMLRRTIHLPQGVAPGRKPEEFDVYRDEAGEIVELAAKFPDWKADSAFIVNDGARIRSMIYTPRVNPGGVSSDLHKTLDSASEEVGIRPIDPFNLVSGIVDLEATVENVGKDAFQFTRLPNEGYRATFRLKNAPNVRVELDAFAKDGFNVSASRVCNEGDELPAQVEKATWKQIDGHWVATRLSAEHRFRGIKSIEYQKDVVAYYFLELNRRVDPTAFTHASMSDKWSPRSAPEGARGAARADE